MNLEDVKQLLRGRNGTTGDPPVPSAVAVAIQDQGNHGAHPHLHVGEDRTALEKETVNRFITLDGEDGTTQATGYLLPSNDAFDKLAGALHRAFTTYLEQDIARVSAGYAGHRRKSWVLDLSAFQIGRATLEIGKIFGNGVRVDVNKREVTDAQNFFLLLVHWHNAPNRFLIQTVYPTQADATKVIRK